MTDLQDPGGGLRRAFQALGDRDDHACSAEDEDRIWRAVSGDLPDDERRALVDRLGAEPALAQAWRIAVELHEAAGAREAAEHQTTNAAPVRARWLSASWLATAAALMLCVSAAVVWVARGEREVYRDAQAYAVEAIAPADAALPRDAFRLRWTPAPAGARYHVRVTTEELEVIADATDVVAAEFLVTPAQLASVPPGTRVLWQVDATLPDGSTVTSRTFAALVQ